MRINMKTVLLKPGEVLPMRREHLLTSLQYVVGEHVELS
jgi:hypothetical protein